MLKDISYQEAEALLGGRVDRRRRFVLDDEAPANEPYNRVLMSAEWTMECSGCYEVGDYGSGSGNYRYDEKAKCNIGMGCKECGYTGKRRIKTLVPASTIELDRQMRD